MQPRPPIVTILGHVDHGKTTLLDTIRKSSLTTKEHGGITQRIGAYEVITDIKGYSTNKLTFIDTPGHEAFSQLRSRGANIADIVLLVIDAKDSLMPQTVESISHIKQANIPFIVVLNKIDLPEANPNKVKNDLLKYEVVTEDKGGTVPTIEISAKQGKGITELLESILLIASDRNLQYDPEASAEAYIIETKKDKRGVIATIIIKNGTLKTGDVVYAESLKAKIKALIDDLGKPVSSILPSTPAELLGFSEIPPVGVTITTAPQAKEAALPPAAAPAFNMDSFMAPEKEKKLSLIVKTDSQGSLEAVTQSLNKNENLEIILSNVGNIHRSDVFLAKTAKAIIAGFNVGMDNEVQELAKQEKVVIKTYNIIYEMLEELEEVSDILKEKEEKEKNVKGEAKIMANFVIEGEKIWGVKVTKGKVNIADNIHLYRGTELIGKSRLVSLKHRAKSVEEIKKDQEAGMIFSPPLDIKVGDVVEFIL